MEANSMEVLTQYYNCRLEDERYTLEAIGIRFGTPDRSGFRQLLLLPAGWTVDSKMNTGMIARTVFDDRGRRRIFINEGMHPHQRMFSILSRFDYSGNRNGRNSVSVTIRDAGDPIYTIGPASIAGMTLEESSKLLSDMEFTAKEWLYSEFPDWKSVTSHWDLKGIPNIYLE